MRTFTLTTTVLSFSCGHDEESHADMESHSGRLWEAISVHCLFYHKHIKKDSLNIYQS